MGVALCLAALLFLVLAILFLNGKGGMLIAGYNTAPPEEREQMDETALCRFMGKGMLYFAACFFFMATAELFHHMAPLWIGLILFLAGALFLVIYANTGNRFRK